MWLYVSGCLGTLEKLGQCRHGCARILFREPVTGVRQYDDANVAGDAARLIAKRAAVRLSAADRQYRNSQLRRRELGELARRLGKGIEVSPARRHPSGTR